MTNPIQTLASILRKTWNADDIIALRRELAPAYEEITTNRGIEIVEFRCRGAEQQGRLAEHLRQHGLDFITHYAVVNSRDYFSVRPRSAIGLATARVFVKDFK